LVVADTANIPSRPQNMVVAAFLEKDLFFNGLLGGCWWPLEIGPPIFRTIAHCLPTGWALDALHQLISFGGGLGDAAKPLAVLAAFGAAANVLAAWLFRWG
jgi:ABC-type multidrug transport system permease subunit